MGATQSCSCWTSGRFEFQSMMVGSVESLESKDLVVGVLGGLEIGFTGVGFGSRAKY